jgi:hypothetical protein
MHDLIQIRRFFFPLKLQLYFTEEGKGPHGMCSPSLATTPSSLPPKNVLGMQLSLKRGRA